MSSCRNGRGARVQGRSVPNISACGFAESSSASARQVEIGPAETGGLDAGAALDEPQQRRKTVAGQAQVVDVDPGKRAQAGLQLDEIAGAHVELGVPTDDLVRPVRQLLQVLQGFRTAAEQVDPHGAHPAGVQLREPARLDIGRKLRDTGESRSELAQRRHQVALVEALERAGHDGTADHPRRGGRAVVLDRERVGPVAAVIHQREARIDDVQMAVEQTARRTHPRSFPRAASPDSEHRTTAPSCSTTGSRPERNGIGEARTSGRTYAQAFPPHVPVSAFLNGAHQRPHHPAE